MRQEPCYDVTGHVLYLQNEVMITEVCLDEESRRICYKHT